MLGDFSSEDLAKLRVEAKEKLKVRILEFEGKLSIQSRKLFNWCPSTYKENWMDAYEGKLSAKKAIKLQCLECVGYSRTDVSGCRSIECPLFHHRPFQEKK